MVHFVVCMLYFNKNNLKQYNTRLWVCLSSCGGWIAFVSSAHPGLLPSSDPCSWGDFGEQASVPSSPEQELMALRLHWPTENIYTEWRSAQNRCGRSEHVSVLGQHREEQGEAHAWLGKKEVTRGAGGGGLACVAPRQSAIHPQLLSTVLGVIKARSLVSRGY